MTKSQNAKGSSPVRSSSTASESITPAEMEVLILIGEGFSNKEIANKLYISVRTVETRRKNLIQKTKTKNTASLIKFAVLKGLIR